VDGNLTPGVEPDEALKVVNNGGAEVLGGGGRLDPVHHSESGILEAPPSFRGDGRGVRVRRQVLVDVHHGRRSQRSQQ
jgi:hypothetical protein